MAQPSWLISLSSSHSQELFLPSTNNRSCRTWRGPCMSCRFSPRLGASHLRMLAVHTDSYKKMDFGGEVHNSPVLPSCSKKLHDQKKKKKKIKMCLKRMITLMLSNLLSRKGGFLKKNKPTPCLFSLFLVHTCDDFHPDLFFTLWVQAWSDHSSHTNNLMVKL